MIGLLILSLLLLAPTSRRGESGHVTEEQYIKLHKDSQEMLKKYPWLARR